MDDFARSVSESTAFEITALHRCHYVTGEDEAAEQRAAGLNFALWRPPTPTLTTLPNTMATTDTTDMTARVRGLELSQEVAGGSASADSYILVLVDAHSHPVTSLGSMS